MELEVLGIGNAFTATHYNTSFLIRGSENILIDGPQGLLRCLRERNVTAEEIAGVIVTHIHGDHTAGLETLLLYKRYCQGCRTPLFTSRKVYEQLSTRFFPGFADTFDTEMRRIVGTEFEEYVDFRELDEEGATQITEGLSVEIRHNWHPTPTLGLKLKTRDRTVGISGDTCFRPRLLRKLREDGTISEQQYDRLAGNWLWDSDLIYHEVDRVPGGPHTHEDDLLALGPDTCSRMRVIHVPDGFEERDIPIASEGERVKLVGPLEIH